MGIDSVKVARQRCVIFNLNHNLGTTSKQQRRGRSAAEEESKRIQTGAGNGGLKWTVLGSNQ